MKWLGVLSIGLCAAFAGGVGAEILDDSQSPRQQYEIEFRWEESGDVFQLDANALNTMTGVLRDVEVRLDTRAFQGQPAQIFLRIPEQINGLGDSAGFRINWTTRGVLASGSTTPGNRALIFDGVIESPLIIDFFNFNMDLDARHLTGVLRLEPIYDIETF